MIKNQRSKFEIALSKMNEFLTLQGTDKEMKKKFFNQLKPICLDSQTKVVFQFDYDLNISTVETLYLKEEELYSYFHQLSCNYFITLTWTHQTPFSELHQGFVRGSQTEAISEGLQLHLNQQLKRFLEEPSKYFLSDWIGFSTNFLPKGTALEVFERLAKDQFYSATCNSFECAIQKKISEGQSYQDYNIFGIWENFNSEFISAKEKLLFKADYGNLYLPKFLYYFVDKEEFYSQFRKLFAENKGKDSGIFYSDNVVAFTSVIRSHLKELSYSEIDTEGLNFSETNVGVIKNLTAFVAEVVTYIYSTDEYLHDFCANDRDDRDDKTWAFLQLIQFELEEQDSQEVQKVLEQFVKFIELIWGALILDAKEKGEFLINISKESFCNIEEFSDYLANLEALIILLTSKEVKVHLLVTEVAGFTEFDDITNNRPSCKDLDDFFTMMDRFHSSQTVNSDLISLTATEGVKKSLDFYEDGVRQGHLFEYYFLELLELKKYLDK